MEHRVPLGYKDYREHRVPLGHKDKMEYRVPLDHKVQLVLLAQPLEVWFTQGGETVLVQTLLEQN